jgi:hypothetical protein
MLDNALIRYHGTDELNRGYALTARPCDCPRCLRWEAGIGPVQARERLRLTDPFTGSPALRCVRPWHVTEISREEAEAKPCITVEEAYDNHA